MDDILSISYNLELTNCHHNLRALSQVANI